MVAPDRQALHWVLKITNRKATIDFLRNVLGMQVLRHEEFDKGCEANCNGPYDGRWSKTMIGYGPEDTDFVLELTYTYGIGSYDYRNDYRGAWIDSQQVVDRVRKSQYARKEDTDDGVIKLISPDGYPFYVHATQRDNSGSSADAAKKPVNVPVFSKILLSVSNLSDSVLFWSNLLGMRIVCSEPQSALLTYVSKSSDGQPSEGAGEIPQCKVELVQQEKGDKVAHGTAFGRVVFTCPQEQLADIEAQVKERGGRAKVQTPLVSLDTPGKATVQVVILADPDGYEVGFVGSEAFWQLCQVDPQADRLIDEAITKDDSDDWYQNKGKAKPSAT